MIPTNHDSIQPDSSDPMIEKSPPSVPSPIEVKPPHDDSQHAHQPIHYAPRTGWMVAMIALLIAAGLATAFFLGTRSRDRDAANLRHAAQEASDQPPPVNVMHVTYAAADNLIKLPGEAKSFYETVIFARTSGYLSKWLVDIGDQVKEGQVLATIDNPELDDQLVAAKAKVEELKAQVNVAQSNVNFAKLSYDRWFGAAPEGAVSEQERDQKKSELDSSLAKLEAAKAQVASGQAEVQRLNTLEKFKTVIAPYDGTITQRHVDVGALVTAGSTNNTSSLFTISQSDQIRVFVDVPQPAVADIKVGMPVSVQVTEYPSRTFTGKVDRRAESIDPASKMLRVQVLVPNDEHLLLPGMYADVRFKASRAKPPLRVPAAALCLRPSGPQVAIVSVDGLVTFHPIKISRDTGDYIEVSSGLNGDETVALNIGNDIVDGSHIEARAIEAMDTTTTPKPATPPPAVSAALNPAPAPVVH